MMMSCRTCRYPLETWTGPLGVTLIHPAAVARIVTPHVTRPVPTCELIDPLRLCDVCSSPDVAWVYEFDGHVMAAGLRLDGDWGLCTPCAAVVDRRCLDGMLQRGMIPFAGDVPADDVARILRPVYGQLLAAGVTKRPIEQAST